MKFKFIFAAILFSFFCTAVSAQTQAEMEMIRQMAKQKGYSDAQIEEMMSKYTGGGSSASSMLDTTSVVDRNQMNPLLIRPETQNQMQLLMMQMQQDSLEKANEIFGHSVFKSSAPNFLPSYNIPTPENYRLSAGDEVIIDVWGAVVTNIRATLSPEGSIAIPNLGPVYLNGQTVAQAEKSVKSYLSRIYSGIESDTPDTFVKLSLGKMRSVTVNVIGEVSVPGLYTMPALTTVSSAIYMAGGLTPIGTVRDIKIFRNGREIATFDLYKYMFSGSTEGDIRLEDNDLISVSSYGKVVWAAGAVKRPMRYEIIENENIGDLLKYSGGFAGNAYPNEVYVERVKYQDNGTGATSMMYTVSNDRFGSFFLEDGDSLSVRETDLRFANRVNIGGAVWRPGDYSLQENITTLDELIAAAGGLKEEAYLQRGYIVRYDSTRSRAQLSFSLQNVILGGDKIMLQPDDSVRIFFKDSLVQKRTVTVDGEVNKPGEFEYRYGMTLGDAVLMAGGLTDAATLERVEVARRIAGGKENLDLKDTIAIILHYNLLSKPEDAETVLSPFDMVYIRRSAVYKPQQVITIEGQVNYPGSYAMEKNVVRLSDVVSKANGFNMDAYPQGATLTRVLTQEEMERLIIAKNIAKNQMQDSTASTFLDSMLVEDRYNIAINLDLAVQNPGSDYDVVLRDGDIIKVPKYNNTVRISGAVLYPNTVTYKPGANYKYYISGGGGFSKEAIKRNTYMIHANGNVAIKGSPLFKVQPGTEIVVPEKSQDDRLLRTQRVSTIMGIATSTASLAAMVTSILNNTK